MPKCKFCGKELKTSFIDSYSSYYWCNCEGSKNYNKLKNEIASLEYSILKRKEELRALELSGEYGKLVKEDHTLKLKMQAFEDCEYENKGQ